VKHLSAARVPALETTGSCAVTCDPRAAAYGIREGLSRTLIVGRRMRNGARELMWALEADRSVRSKVLTVPIWAKSPIGRSLWKRQEG
jgi:hypothetical protein